MSKNIHKRLLVFLIILFLVFTTFGCSVQGSTIQASTPIASGQLKVHFIDIGQADSILVQAPSENVCSCYCLCRWWVAN